MPVTSSTLGGVNVWQFSGAVTDAQIQTAWSALVTNGVYIINRAIYLDNTADLTGCTGGFLVDFGTQVNPAIILHTLRDKTKTVFNNFTFLQRTGLSVGDRTKFVQNWNGTALVALGGGSNDGLQQKGGGLVYGVPGNPGGGDPRYLNEIGLSSLENTTYFSQEFTEQELQPCVGVSTILKNLTFEKCFGFPQIQTLFGNSNVVVYRSTQNTQHPTQLPIRVYPSSLRWASVCYVDSYVTRNNADVTTRLIDMFGSNANQPADVMILNNYTRESWFGASKTTLPVSNWAGGNMIIGGVLKKLQFVNGGGGVVRAYDSRSTTTAQKTLFAETGFRDFLNTNLAPTTDANGKITMVHVGAICTTNSVVVTRYTGQKYTFQKFGYRVMVGTPDMTSGDNDLSAFAPITITAQDGIVRTQAAITAATSITTFQELLEELHVLAIGLQGSASYNGYANGNLFNFDGVTLTTAFATVNVDATATSKIAYNSTTNTLTIKASELTDSPAVQRWNNASGTINVLNGATIKGVYTTSSGTSMIWQFQNITAGTSLAIYDSTGATKYYQNQVATGGTFSYYIPPGVSDTYFYAIEKYGKKREEGDFPANAGTVLFFVPSYADDVGITEPTQSVVEAYTAIDNPEKRYDRLAVFRLTEQGIKLGQISTRAGTSLENGTYSFVVKSSAASVFSLSGNTFTLKASSYEPTTKYAKEICTPPATFTAFSTEIITIPIEDANGDSQTLLTGTANNLVDVWKITNATPVDQFATGTQLATNIGNGAYRFIAEDGFKLVFNNKDNGIYRYSSMSKGDYTVGWYLYDSPTGGLTQEQSTLLNNIYTKNQIIQANVEEVVVDLDDVKGTGFAKDSHSLTNIKSSADTAVALSA